MTAKEHLESLGTITSQWDIEKAMERYAENVALEYCKYFHNNFEANNVNGKMFIYRVGDDKEFSDIEAFKQYLKTK
jgi:hypothetical protein